MVLSSRCIASRRDFFSLSISFFVSPFFLSMRTRSILQGKILRPEIWWWSCVSWHANHIKLAFPSTRSLPSFFRFREIFSFRLFFFWTEYLLQICIVFFFAEEIIRIRFFIFSFSSFLPSLIPGGLYKKFLISFSVQLFALPNFLIPQIFSPSSIRG